MHVELDEIEDKIDRIRNFSRILAEAIATCNRNNSCIEHLELVSEILQKDSESLAVLFDSYCVGRRA